MADLRPPADVTAASGGRGQEVRAAYAWIWRLLVACVVLAVVGASGQLLAPAEGSTFATWLDVAAVPAAVGLLLLLNRGERVGILAIICALLYLEAILTASLFVIGTAFSIIVPIIGIGLIQPHVRGRALLAVYAAAGIVSTASVAIVQAGISPNPIATDQPFLTVVAFGLVTTAALGLLWRAGQQQQRALDAAQGEIARRTEAERRLGRTADALRALIRSSPVATIAFDAGGRLTVWNPAAELLFGWSEAEVLGHGLPRGLEPVDDGAGLEAAVRRIVDGEVVRGERIRGRHRDGHEVTVEIHGDPRSRDGDISTGALVEAIDVTDRAELEARLQQAQMMEAVAKLAGGIAHDINNALTAVGGFAELIEVETNDREVRGHAGTISAAVERAHDLTRQLLAFARRSVLQPQVIAIDDFIASVAPKLRRRLGTDIRLELGLDAAGARVLVDPAQLELAILNIAANAQEAMPAGGVLTIGTSRRGRGGGETDVASGRPRDTIDAAGETEALAVAAPAAERRELGAPGTSATSGVDIVLSVLDTGTGIAPEVVEQVFDPFFSTKDHSPGSGLGLAMVHGFVAQSGGSVQLRSTPSEGTAVEITLPEAVAPTQASRTSTTVGNAHAAAAQPGKERILLVDDEPAVVEFVRHALAAVGYEVLVASSGEAAIELANGSRGPIDLIVSDVVMPGPLGPEVVRAVQRIHPGAAALYISGYTADAIAVRGVLPPGVDLIEKPFSSGKLADRVRGILDSRGRMRPE